MRKMMIRAALVALPLTMSVAAFAGTIADPVVEEVKKMVGFWRT